MATFDEENKKTEKVLIKKAHKMAERNNRVIKLNAAVLSVYGFQMVVPILLGIILGRFLDHFVSLAHISWTLNFILIGTVIGIYNANRWIKKEGFIKKEKHKK